MHILVARQSYFFLLKDDDKAVVTHVILTISYFLLCITKSLCYYKIPGGWNHHAIRITVLAETCYEYSYQIERHLNMSIVMRTCQEYNTVLSKIHVTEVHHLFSRIISLACPFHWAVSFSHYLLLRNTKIPKPLPLH